MGVQDLLICLFRCESIKRNSNKIDRKGRGERAGGGGGGGGEGCKTCHPGPGATY